MSTAERTDTTTMYVASAPAALRPSRAASGTASANTPIGASCSTQRTSVIDVSRMLSKTRTTAERRCASMRVIAMPNAIAKMINGSMAPSAAALIGFAGTRSTSQVVNDGMLRALSPALAAAVALARSAAEAAGSMDSIENVGPAARTPTTPQLTSPIFASTPNTLAHPAAPHQSRSPLAPVVTPPYSPQSPPPPTQTTPALPDTPAP